MQTKKELQEWLIEYHAGKDWKKGELEKELKKEKSSQATSSKDEKERVDDANEKKMAAAHDCKRMRHLSADIDGVLRSFEKAAKEEAQLCGGVSRENVNIPKRLDEMKIFCEKFIGRAAAAAAAEDDEEEEEEEEEDVVGDCGGGGGVSADDEIMNSSTKKISVDEEEKVEGDTADNKL